jgi:hypothetical protein
VLVFPGKYRVCVQENSGTGAPSKMILFPPLFSTAEIPILLKGPSIIVI